MRRREVLKASAWLLGTAVSASVSRALLADELPLSGEGAFPDAQRAAVELLSDLIIPPTDTPGAAAAGVPDFVATIFRDWYNDDERAGFLQGLSELDQFCIERGGNTFHEAADDVRLAALREQEAIAASMPPPPPGPFGSALSGAGAPFFIKLRELVVLGYYTSEIGATRELVYRPAPGRFVADADFAEVGRQWSR